MRQSKLKVEQEASSAAGMKGGQEEQQASSPPSMARPAWTSAERKY